MDSIRDNKSKEDEVFKMRHVPDMPSNLSARIIDAAKKVPQDVVWYKKLRFPVFSFGFADGGFRQPALAFGVVALFVFGGFYVTQDQQPLDVSSDDEVYLAFYVDDILGSEDYL